jgi:Zn-dependent protease with chaperone function
MASLKQSPADPTAHLKLPRILVKTLITPLLVLAFYAASIPWANHKLQQELLNELNQDSKLSSAQKEKRATALSSIDFAAAALHPSPDQSERLTQFLEGSGLAGRFRRLHLGLLLCYALLGILAVATLAILALNARAKKSRESLIRSYRIAWLIASVAAIAQVLLLTPLLTYAAFEVTVLASDSYYPQLLLVLAIGGIAAIAASVKILLKKVPLKMDEPMARELLPADAPEVWTAVRGAAARLQTSPPDHIIIGMQLNFYVTEFAVRHGFGCVEGKTLFLSYPLIRQLSRDEILAIIGHELGHFIGEDTRLTREFYPMRLKVSETLHLLGSNPLITWTSYQFLTIFAWTFAKTEHEASRARELMADERGAALTSPATAARALVKFHAMSEAFDRGLASILQTNEGAAASFETALRHKLPSDPEFWNQVLEERLPHPLDSHPKLSVRLAALGQELTIQQIEAIAQEECPSAFGEWFGQRQDLFAELLQKTDAVVKVMREKTRIASADYSTEAGKQLLDRHFPERKWQRKPSKPWFAVSIAALLAGGAGLLAFLLPEPGIIAGVVAFIFILAVVIRIHWIRHRNGEVTLTPTGIFYTGWVRPLLFNDVESMSAHTYNGETSVIFKLKRKIPAIWKSSLRREARTISLPVMRLTEKPFNVANTIFQYLTRQATIEPTVAAAANSQAQN